MFDIGWSEILVIAIITILVVGPKELPGLLRTVGRTVGNVRRMAGDFQNQFNEALKEAELDDVKNTIGDVRKLNPATAVKDAVSKQLTEIGDATDDVASDLKKSSDEISSSVSDSGASNSETADLLDDDPAPEPHSENAVASNDKSAEEPSDSKDETVKAE